MIGSTCSIPCLDGFSETSTSLFTASGSKNGYYVAGK